jgi:phosphoribosylformylglycinamidine synthase
VLAYCGLRWGEATGLRVRNLDMLRRRLAVEENAVQVGNVVRVGTPPPVDLAAERRNGDFVRDAILGGRVSAAHDVSDGGLLVAVAEMALAGGIGATVEPPAEGLSPVAWAFGEDQARYVVSTNDAEALLAAAGAAGVPAHPIGRTGGDSVAVVGQGTVGIDELRRTHERFLPALMTR